MNIISSLGVALGVFSKDKWIAVFSLIPVIVGAAIYVLFGTYIYGDLLDKGRAFIESSINSNGWSQFFFWLLAGILTIAFYFLVSWTFVLIVSAISSPFNDIISNRTEKVLIGESPEDVGLSFKRIFSRLGFTLVNEFKKVSFIIFLNLIAFALSFLGVLAPLSILISSLLMAVGFLDYSWSRKGLTFKSCLSDVKSSLLTYGIMGGVFLVLITIPLVNLFVLPFGVVYFTVLHIEKSSSQVVQA